MSKICAVFSHPSHYRESIYKLIDQEYDCDWFFSDEEVDVKRLDLSVLKNVQVNHFKMISKRLNVIEGIQSLLSDKRYDTYVMLGGTVCISIWWFLLRARLFYPKKRIYLWGHGWYGKESKLESFIKSIIFKSATGMFVYGEHSKKLLIDQGLKANNVFVIHNSLHYDQQMNLRKCIKPSMIYQEHFKNDLPTVIFIGRMTKVKMLDQVIKALFILKQKGERFNLVFVGDGSEREALEIEVKELGLQNDTWFYGACYDERTNADLIYNADLCVSPGNVGLTAIHTLMFGTPVITHNNFKYQMPEYEAIKEGMTGLFFEYNNVQSLAENISQWMLKSSTNREGIRENCYNVIDRDWNPYAQIKVIKSAI